MKYFYLIPMGGLCDIITKINQALQYCIKYNRKLYIDTRYSSYKHNIFKFITVNHKKINKILIILKKLELKNLSIYPPELNNEFQNILNKNINLTFIPPKTYLFNNIILNRKPKTDITEDIIIFCNHGGSKNIFEYFNKYITIKNNIKIHCKEMIKKINYKYLGIHIRNTDRKINIKKLYEKNKDLFNKYKYIYISTDDINSINYFKSLNLNIINFTNFSNNNDYNLHSGYNLHSDRNISCENKFKDLFFDMYAIINASDVLLKSNGGFSRLLRISYKNKVLVLNKFNI